jgi:hypothetical protein
MSENNDWAINKIIHLMQTDESVDAPASAVRWSKNIFRARAVEPKKSVLERIFAILQMDLPPAEAVFGERSAAASQARQMLFQAGENALDIRIAKTGHGFNLHGQILGRGFANGTVKLGDFETAVNEIGEFRLKEIPGGIYNLIVQGSEKEIVVRDLELK